ncbi:MAG: phosphoketolase family protein [Candidatus Peribacteraceae bacterium]|nr:phosphoketolase family protein [Candidatus Peribacteraceae bacterium]
MALKKTEIAALEKFVRATNYLSVAQIYLRDNFLLERPLRSTDIKPRLLGHWGTCPGINFVYAHINRLIQKTGGDFLYIVGPGHGFPAVQANLFLEKSLSHFYPQKIPFNKKGLAEICGRFSAPYGYPSHSNPEAPGTILEGGELGYSLSVAFGSVLDNPKLVTVCLVGDGESETGPLAAAWNCNKIMSPRENGAVLPIVHINGYKISGPTVFGRMSDTEILKFFEGLGYRPHFVTGDSKQVFTKMAQKMDNALSEIHKIQRAARSGKQVEKPRWPVIILRTPKGWTGTKFDGKTKLEGNCLSHQVILKESRDDQRQLAELEKWLRSYKFDELISVTKNGKLKLDGDIAQLIPRLGKSCGSQKYARGGEIVKKLKLPRPEKFSIKFSKRGMETQSSMAAGGEFLAKVFADNKNIRLFSPDETYSNKLDAIFRATKRSWQWPLAKWDTDFGRDGRVMELLSEHTLFGLLHGYVTTGRHGFFASYEAFTQIVASMADQFCKFVKASRGVKFRPPLPAMNLILTSLLERQDHNGFSHQNPSLLSSMLEKDGNLISAFLPPDANCLLATLDESLRMRNALNLIVVGKKDLPVWLSPAEAKKQMREGILEWKFVSDQKPDIVLAASGDYATNESLAAIKILRKLLPKVRIRFVNISELTALGVGDPTTATNSKFLNKFFTTDKNVIFNFHGYPATIKKLLFDYTGSQRIQVNGYEEEGSTTTPLDLEIRNRTSRFHLVLDAAEKLAKQKDISRTELSAVQKNIASKIREHRQFILREGVDPPEVENWNLLP